MTATPPKFGTAPVEEGDEFFALQSLICVDCRQVFETSRHSLRCATCRSLRQGQVGPATVTCLACGIEHQVPILAPHKLCKECASDLDATERHIRETLAAAELRFQNAVDAWDAAYAQADPKDRDRYYNVLAARAAAAVGFHEKYQRARDRGDGLSVLLKAKEACDAVTKEVEAARDAH